MYSPDIHYNDGFSEKWIEQLSPPEWRNNVTVRFEAVPFSRLEHDACWSDPDVVSGWKSNLVKGGSIPPPVATLTERGTYYLHDGNHRYLALRDYLNDGTDPMVRVAVAIPQRGYRFAYTAFGEYGTYVIEKIPRRLARISEFAAAVAASAIATAITLLVSRATDSPVFVFFVVSVMVAAWLGGLVAGLITTATNMAGAAYFLLPPDGSLLIQNVHHFRHWGLSGLSMLAVAAFVALIRQHRPLELGLHSNAERPRVADSPVSGGYRM